MVFVIVTGGIDLSVGYGSGFVSVVAAWLLYHGYADKWIGAILPGLGAHAPGLSPPVVVVALGLLLATLMGAFQGFIISRLSVPPFIVTLGGFSIFKSGHPDRHPGQVALHHLVRRPTSTSPRACIPPIGGVHHRRCS